MKESLKKSLLRWTYVEGLFFALMVASSEAYALFHFTKQGLAPLQIALMTTLPLLFGAIAQFIVPRLITDRTVGLGVLLSILFQIAGLVILIECARNFTSFTLLLTGLSFYWVGGQTGAPLWIDWVARLTGDQEQFAQYLARRNTVVVLFIMVFYFGLSLLIDSSFALPFSLLFTGGLIARAISFAIQAVLTVKVIKADRLPAMIELSHEPLLPELPSSDTLKILYTFFFWTALFRLSVNISAPFFLPYMVEELRMTTIEYALLTSIPLLGRALFLHNWSRASDQVKIFWGIQIACLFIAFAPVLWTFSTNRAYLAGLEFFGGVFWGGFELMAILMVQQMAGRKARALLGLHMAAMTILAVIGALIGGALLKGGLTYFDVFWLSSIARFMIAGGLILHVYRSYPDLALKRHNTLPYLSSVLSLRPSMANINRIIIPKRQKKSEPL